MNQSGDGSYTARVARFYICISRDSEDIQRQERIFADATALGFDVAAVYCESASGARADRPELQRMIEDLQLGEVVIAERVSLICRLPPHQAEQLMATIRARGAYLAVPGLIDLTEIAASTEGTAKIMHEVRQHALLELAPRIARSEYELRRERQLEGIKRAQSEGRYRGRGVNGTLHARILALRRKGTGIRETAEIAGCSASHVKRVWANRPEANTPEKSATGRPSTKPWAKSQ
ncbi:recombinase family protein [Sphingomonas sp. OTU376]|uniref:recombinase family protein n=1 Tax=Sphingomonas sp. OTU376 TaxID=3043863 RepID=UPI00313AD0A9